ncbi:MAG: hypothetical protein R6U89_08595 [Dehalococcoidia bacterium]
MVEEQQIVIPKELLNKIDEHRGSMSSGDFIQQCVGQFLSGETGRGLAGAEGDYVTREEFKEFKENMRSLQRSFIHFMLTYCIEHE